MAAFTGEKAFDEDEAGIVLGGRCLIPHEAFGVVLVHAEPGGLVGIVEGGEGLDAEPGVVLDDVRGGDGERHGGGLTKI
jgi:hypothetical protein